MNYLYLFGLTILFSSAMVMCFLGLMQFFHGHELKLYFNEYGEGNLEAGIGMIGLVLLPWVWYRSISTEVNNEKSL